MKFRHAQSHRWDVQKPFTDAAKCRAGTHPAVQMCNPDVG